MTGVEIFSSGSGFRKFLFVSFQSALTTFRFDSLMHLRLDVDQDIATAIVLTKVPTGFGINPSIARRSETASNADQVLSTSTRGTEGSRRSQRTKDDGCRLWPKDERDHERTLFLR